MKQTEIFYRKISPNVIKITKIENALSLSKIRMQFGDDVTEEYRKGARYYVLHDVLYVKKETFERQITVDSVTTKQDFTNIISIMKEAGERLRQIIAENKIVNGERLRQIIAEYKLVENWGKKKSEGNNEKDSKSIWIQNLSDISLISMKEKINEELIKRDKLKNPLVTFMIHDDPIIKHFENISYREKKLNALRKNFYRGDIKEVKVKIDIEKGQMIKEKDIIKPDCFRTDKEAEECCHCKYFTECGQVYRKKLKEEKIAKEIRTIKI